MRKEFRIKIDPSVNICGLEKETRDIVLKNFKNHDPNKLYSSNRFAFGLFELIGVGDKCTLLKGTSVIKSDVTYLVYSVEYNRVCLALKVYDKHKHEIRLEGDCVMLAIDYEQGDETLGYYHFLEGWVKRLDDVKPYVKDIDCNEWLSCSFSPSSGRVYITSYIPPRNLMTEGERHKSAEVYFTMVS